MSPLGEGVAQLLRGAATDVVLPLYRHEDAAAREKNPGDWVTEADHRSEELLTRELPRLLPGSVVVGEEAVSADRSVLDRLSQDDPVWLVDPVDGTRNFVRGQGPFAMMVALVERGETLGGWIHLPLEGRMVCAQLGEGARLEGARLDARHLDRPLVGAIARDSLPGDLSGRIEEACASAGATLVPTWACSGRDYPSVLTGEWDFLLPWTVLPWDHAAGAFITGEAGGRAARLDGRPYRPADPIEPGLLVARTPEIWEQVRALLEPAL